MNDTVLITAFETYLIAEKRIASNTFSAYQHDVKQLLLFLQEENIRLQECTKERLVNFLKYLKEKGLTAKSLARKVSALKSLFSFLTERYGFTNYASGLVFPKLQKSLPTYLTAEE